VALVAGLVFLASPVRLRSTDVVGAWSSNGSPAVSVEIMADSTADVHGIPVDNKRTLTGPATWQLREEQSGSVVSLNVGGFGCGLHAERRWADTVLVLCSDDPDDPDQTKALFHKSFRQAWRVRPGQSGL
jgi:hypothetical protein